MADIEYIKESVSEFRGPPSHVCLTVGDANTDHGISLILPTADFVGLLDITENANPQLRNNSLKQIKGGFTLLDRVLENTIEAVEAAGTITTRTVTMTIIILLVIHPDKAISQLLLGTLKKVIKSKNGAHLTLLRGRDGGIWTWTLETPDNSTQH